jgi:ankyrin repeat protein
MEPTFQSILHLLAWNGYEDEAYLGSQVCKETWEDDRIYRKVNRPLGARKSTLIGIHTYQTNTSSFTLNRIKRMVRLGADPDVSNLTNSFTPLMDLCLEGDHYKMDIFDYILSLNVRVDGVEGMNWCPLSLLGSIGTGKKKMEKLLARGANVNRVDANGRSVLYTICMMDGYSIPENIHFLCDHGADVHLRDIFGQTALDVCLEYNYPTWAEALIQHGAILPEGAMARALTAKLQATVELLLRLGVSIDPGALVTAIDDDDDEMVRLLIDVGVPIDGYDRPLLVSAAEGHISQNTVNIIRHLCSAGARVNEKWFVEAYSPMTLAYRMVEEPVLNGLIRKYIIGFREYTTGSNIHVIESISILIDHGAVPPASSEYDFIYPFSIRPLLFSDLISVLFRGRYASAPAQGGPPTSFACRGQAGKGQRH